MEVKAFELRDKGTCMPAVAIRLTPANEAEHWILRRGGYACSPGDTPEILLGHVEGGRFNYDEYEATTTTTRTAIPYIRENWDQLKSGDVICTEFIRGERTEPKISERLDERL